MPFYFLNFSSLSLTLGTCNTMNTDIMQVTTFRIGEALFGLAARQVQEILPYQTITLVPLAPEYVKGLITLRGQIVTALDLRRRLGFEALEDDTTGTNLIVTSDEGPLSLFVDQIGTVVDIHTDHLKLPPGTVRGIAASSIQAVCQLEDELLIVLDTKSVLRVT